jgi:tetratricopeptide (TPR) repeat protein
MTATTQLSTDSIQKLYANGVEQYGQANYTAAIESWKIVLRNAETIKDSTNQIKTSTNIGACYNAMGYHKTALGYFLKADKMLLFQKEKKENYWINYINIGVCYMSLEQYDSAKKYFESTADFNDHILILKSINLAKWHADKGQKDLFFYYKSRTDNAIKKMPIYQGAWHVVQLNYMITLNDLSPLKILLAEIQPTYKEEILHLKLTFNKAYFAVYKKLYESIADLLVHSKEIAAATDYNLKELFYGLLKDYYFQQENLERYNHYATLSLETLKARYDEKNMLYIEDVKTAQEFEELKNTIVEIKQENNIITSHLKKSQLLFRFSLCLLVLGVIVVILLLMNYSKKKKINKLSHLQTHNKLLLKEIEKLELIENLKLSEEELNNAMINVKKLMLLRKQLMDLTTSTHELSDKEVIRQIKLTLTSFFDNYRELNLLINKKVNVGSIIENLRGEFDTINEREFQIIEFILYQFTTKEIALLTDKSEKAIQYNRTQIRKKLNLDSTITLEEYLHSKQ